MKKRRKSRECALIVLYQKEVTRTSLEEVLCNFWLDRNYPEDVVKFTEKLVKGTVATQDEIDSYLKKYSENWEFDRIGIIEKNILRFAMYELMSMGDIPSSVTINEAVELTKKFGSRDSYQFVNGILDKVKEDLGVAQK